VVCEPPWHVSAKGLHASRGALVCRGGGTQHRGAMQLVLISEQSRNAASAPPDWARHLV